MFQFLSNAVTSSLPAKSAQVHFRRIHTDKWVKLLLFRLLSCSPEGFTKLQFHQHRGWRCPMPGIMVSLVENNKSHAHHHLCKLVICIFIFPITKEGGHFRKYFSNELLVEAILPIFGVEEGVVLYLFQWICMTLNLKALKNVDHILQIFL